MVTDDDVVHIAHFRSFSDSHYQPSDETNKTLTAGLPDDRVDKADTRIWTKLRTSFRMRKSSRFTLPRRSSKKSAPIPSFDCKPSADVPDVTVVDDDVSSTEETTPPLFEYQLNRISSVMSQLKSVPFLDQLSSSSGLRMGCYIGLCLPVHISSFHPSADMFDGSLNQAQSASDVFSLPFCEDVQFMHVTAHCIVCCQDMAPAKLGK